MVTVFDWYMCSSLKCPLFEWKLWSLYSPPLLARHHISSFGNFSRTYKYKKHYLPLTSFAGGKNLFLQLDLGFGQISWFIEGRGK